MKLLMSLFSLLVFNGYSQNIGRDQAPQNTQDLAEFIKKIEKYNEENPIEKVYLHVDRDITSAGDDLWYTAYLTLGAYHTFSNASQVLYIDFINANNEVAISQTQALVDGRCNGSMSIPKELPFGNYRLRAYTKWMTNYDADFFFYKTITIVGRASTGNITSSSTNKINLRFFPEGGQLVENIPSRVALKAMGYDGSGKKIEGRIVDATNKFICTINSTPQGFGIFRLHPETGMTYKAILNDGSIYDLPAVVENGYSMIVNNLDYEKVRVRVSASDAFKNKLFYIIGSIRNQKCFQAKYVLDGDSFFDFEIPKDKLLSGVLTITLFDMNLRPRCERLVFVNNTQNFNIKVTPNTSTFAKRAPISLRINVRDDAGRPISTQLSIAVTDASYIKKNEYDRNIMTYLLLESDIKGRIDNPGSLFKDKERSTLFNLDLVMMTHGWRKYKWQDVLNGTDPTKENDFELGITVSGTAYGRDKKPLANTSIKMIGLSDAGLFAYPTLTNDSGHFKITDVRLSDSTRVTFNGYNHKNKQIDVKIDLDQNEVFPVGELENHHIGFPKKEEIDSLGNTDYNRIDDDSIFDNVTELDEVVVIEKELRRPESPSLYGIVPDAVVYQDENSPKDLSFLLSNIPGVLISGGIGSLDVQVTIRGTSTFKSGDVPLWIVDGSILGPDSNPFQFLSSADIERIEVLKGSSTANFGARGSNGVILIYTRRGGPSPTSLSSKSNFEFILAHSGQKEFYNPEYDKPNNDQKKPDNRKTLFWDPSVNTDEKGNATITFFNSDFAERIQVVVDFLTEQGEPGFYASTLKYK